MLVKIALQSQERFANHARLLGVVLDTFNEDPVEIYEAHGMCSKSIY